MLFRSVGTVETTASPGIFSSSTLNFFYASVKEKISEMKDMTILDTGLTIKSAMHADQKAELDALADAIVNSMV